MTKKKIGIWMYENDNGINIKKKLVSSLKDLGYEVYSDFDMRECYLKNGKVYAANMKEERKVMNDNIRYNVFKRDNFTCKICGATQADGVKLHVDHIIPVSMGGKTVMSNLQTLCDRCNIGKGNKVDKDFVDDMICPKCGAKLVKRSGKYGDFIGCSNYPHCRYKRKL